MYNKLSNLISMINLAAAKRTKSFEIYSSKFIMDVISKLLKLGIIRGFMLNGNKVEVFMKYVDNRVPFIKVSQVSKVSSKGFVKYNKLKYISDRNGSSVFILTTSSGLKFNYECLNENIGGEIIMKIDL